MNIHTYQKADGYWVAAFQVPGTELFDQLRDWCYTVYGKGQKFTSMFCEADARWVDQIRYGEIDFRDEKDLTWFVLNWSSTCQKPRISVKF